ncbi:MAG: TetR/AcrR family transcriptional regulator [Streptosporangiales bacterium]|nr:TetR/AcrR family transcriptional regulator [Streptosporangiales bacterium]
MTTAAQAAGTDGNDAFRQRLLGALAESIADDGYRATTVAGIVRRARTSRRTFYEHFADKEACFLALLAEKNQDLIRAVTSAIDFGAPWEAQVRQAITSYIATVEAEPALTVSWIRELPSLGTRAQALQRDMLETFVTLVQTLSETEEMKAAGIPPVRRQVAIIMLGGLRELIAWTVEDDASLSGIIETSVQSATALLRAGLDPA